MRFSVSTLFDVQFEHSYFSHLYDGFTIGVSLNTEYQLRNYGLYFKPYSGGFKVLYDTEFAGKQRSREDILESKLVLHFKADLKDAGFFNYTSGTYRNLSDHIFYFSNNKSPLTANLQKGESVSEKDLYNYPLPIFQDNFFTKPFAKIVLKLSADIPEVYRVRFDAKSSFWRYILVSEALKDLKSPAVVDEKAIELFNNPVEIILPSNAKALAIISKKPLQLSSRPKAIFQLVENYKEGELKHRTVIRALPAPDINSISGLPAPNDIGTENFSDIYIT